jgi:hypothetical protein
LQYADLPKHHAKKLNNLPHAQSIRRRLNSYNFDAGLDYNFLQPQSIRSWLDLLNKRTANCLNKRIRFQAGSIVANNRR